MLDGQGQPLPTAAGKIIDAYKALFLTRPVLSEKDIFTDRSKDDPLATEDLDAIVIYAEAWEFGRDAEQGQWIHRMALNCDVIGHGSQHGAINRATQEIIGEIVAAVGSDPLLGGRLQDAQPGDIAPPMDNGRSVGGASLQIALTFYTPAYDLFTLVGEGGARF